MPITETQQSGPLDPGQTVGATATANVLGEMVIAREATAEETRRAIPTRRKLSDEQERQVARLYAETPMSASEIARGFAIAASSVHRIAQRHGVAPRTASPTAARRQRSHNPRLQTPDRGGKQPFRIRFEVEEVLEAVDVRDALQQAAARGITGITAVNRES